MKVCDLTIHEIRDKLNSQEISSAELIDSFYRRIDEVEDRVKAYVTLTEEEARKRAEEKLTGALAGIPLAVKDNISTKGVRTSCSSKMLDNYIPPFNATVINRLYKTGAIMLGKTNLDEFAMGSSTERSAFHPTHNPWNLDYVPGGSSGGSAAAVAAGEATAALGSDTGGSIRQPAAYCGVVGFKPTYGNVSRYGLIAYASSLDQIGPIIRDVEDAAILLNIISGKDPLDSSSVKVELPDYTHFLKQDVQGMKIGLPREYFDMDFDNQVKDSVLSAVNLLKEAGAEIEEVNLPAVDYALAAYYIIAPAEASSNLARYDGVRYGYRSEKATDMTEMFTTSRKEGFGSEVKRRIMLGTYTLSTGYYNDYYLKAQKVRTLIMEDFKKLFKEYDLLLSPTTPTTAFELGSISDPLEMYQMDVFTVPVNIAGIPAISILCGFDDKGLPIGLQLMGPHFGEGKILQAAYTLEELLAIKDKRPKLEVSG
ncbi:MAG TPA: Asp-tRNA(Asn)/Glu-tRNA(Gln) amidotransferase subunit GatA [Halanaerobiales bacterium]|nr:Asp-tRNA(Asn)/Glu-tRNA(Gln) amidotransferase subunit GatA [Halanaerobiales bacterium]